ncbi:MAG: Veg family protein [Bacilli bacterium]|nr:Veg family protein [Bacilli bacterium]
MNIKKIKEQIELLKNKKIHFKVNGSRNQIEEFDGIITETYNYIFIIEIDNLKIKKSFSYSDVLINNIEITK